MAHLWPAPAWCARKPHPGHAVFCPGLAAWCSQNSHLPHLREKAVSHISENVLVSKLAMILMFKWPFQLLYYLQGRVLAPAEAVMHMLWPQRAALFASTSASCDPARRADQVLGGENVALHFAPNSLA